MIGFEELMTEATEQMADDIEIQAKLCLLRAARLAEHRQRNLCRPSLIVRPSLQAQLAGNGATIWTASYGSLFASGHTPDDAYSAFDEIWVRGV